MAYLAEYLPRIGIVQISFTDNYELDHITEKQVLMKNGETFNLPHQVILDPGNDATSKNVKSLVNEKVISIRCKAVGGARLKSSANHSTLCFYEKWNSIELKKLHGFFLVCNNCQEKVLDSIYYDKIYDLPSENWTELMDLWHCHKPDENVNFFYQSSMNNLIPANKELFIGESYFLINNSNACLIKGKLIECKKCFSELVPVNCRILDLMNL
ncbi:uncharacterized protein SCODWIG_00409 [Saccharomycodes ludwigii]|uniref:Uncharacterized protein n=1 Tax=Saccharomycodes ludwigii TaxID=36035 RepID=A0A376B1T7_9ASCO|nr:uncharacterized protein SCODWIG_00409 [Saccharomycodes ludwigii]